jgi:uncharacterized protein (DUF2147 family)
MGSLSPLLGCAAVRGAAVRVAGVLAAGVLAAGVFATGLLATGSALAADPPIGEWLVKDGYAQVRVENCGGALWGVITWEAKPGGRDNENPDAALRGRPILGMPILLDMKEKTVNNWGTKEQRWVGHIYNSENGKTYDGNVKLQSPNVMKLEGCVAGFLCGGQDWTRVAASPSGPQSKGPAPKSQPKGAPASDVCSRITR